MPIRTTFFAILLVTASSFTGFCQGAGVAVKKIRAPEALIYWQTPARLRQRLTSRRGTLEIGNWGIVFRTEKRPPVEWSFTDIQSFYLTPYKLNIRSYKNRGWRLPGEKVYRFDLARAAPPELAAALAKLVGKPSQNGDPNPHQPTFATIPARHSTRTGGSNGILRFNEDGIDYVTLSGRDSRSWLWADIQTLAHPDPYHFTVDGYRETFYFKLKQPMPPALFDRLWDLVYGRGLQLSAKRSVKQK